MFKTVRPQTYQQPIAPDLQTIIAIPERISALPLSQCELSVRLQNVLGKLSCKRLGDLHGLSFAQVLTVTTCGLKTIKELETFIAKLHGAQVQLRETEKASHSSQKQQTQAVL